MQLNPKILVSVFGLIFLAELPDKTVFATLMLAARRQHHALGVFVGAAAAFLVQTIVAVAFGHAFSMLPAKVVKIVAGLMFLGFAADMWFRLPEKQEQEGEQAAEKAYRFHQSAWAAFVVIFIAEWGDLTQLATAAMVAHYKNHLSVFLGAVGGLWAASGLAVLVGSRLKHMIEPRKLQRAAAVAFAVVGIIVLAK
jgi:putative Ca2+/H+ antiporter (TMEM165/GDT1 family)